MYARIAPIVALLIGLAAAAPACSRKPATTQAQTPAKWSIAPLGPDAAAGKTFNALVSVAIDKGWKVYSLTQKPGTGLPVPLTITVSPGPSFESAGAPAGPQAETQFDSNFNVNTEV